MPELPEVETVCRAWAWSHWAPIFRRRCRPSSVTGERPSSRCFWTSTWSPALATFTPPKRCGGRGSTLSAPATGSRSPGYPLSPTRFRRYWWQLRLLRDQPPGLRPPGRALPTLRYNPPRRDHRRPHHGVVPPLPAVAEEDAGCWMRQERRFANRPVKKPVGGSGIRYPVSGIRYLVSGIWYPVSGIWYPVLRLRQPDAPARHGRFTLPRSLTPGEPTLQGPGDGRTHVP